jgi:hypothetical protein
MNKVCPPAQGKTDKSFLVLFFKKEQKKESSFLKKRSKKLLHFGPGGSRFCANG